MGSFSNPLPVPNVPQGGGLLGGIANWQKIAGNNIANQQARLQAGILQRQLNYAPIDEQLKAREGAANITNKELANKYYAAQANADINYKNAMASLIPTQAQNFMAEAQYHGMQARQIKQQMDNLSRYQNALQNYMGVANPQQSTSTAIADLAGSPVGGAPTSATPAQPQQGQSVGTPQSVSGEQAAGMPQQVEINMPEPDQLRKSRQLIQLANMAGATKQELPIPLKDALDRQQKDYGDFIKNQQTSADAAQAAQQILALIPQMREAYRQASMKGNPLAAEWGKRFNTYGQQVNSLVNSVLLQKMGDLKGAGGKATNVMIGILSGSKPDLSMQEKAFMNATNNLQNGAMQTVEFNKFLNSANNNYVKAGYGAAIPENYVSQMYNNYRNNVATQDEAGNMYYNLPDQNNEINQYTGLQSLYNTSSNSPYHVPTPDLDENEIRANMGAHPDRTRGQIIAALRRRKQRGFRNVGQ